MKFCHLIRGCRHYGDVKYGNPLSHQKWKISTLFVTSWKQPWTAIMLGYWLKYILQRILPLTVNVLFRKDIYRISGSCFPGKILGIPRRLQVCCTFSRCVHPPLVHPPLLNIAGNDDFPKSAKFSEIQSLSFKAGGGQWGLKLNQNLGSIFFCANTMPPVQ